MIDCTEGGKVTGLLRKRESDEISALENRWLKRHLDACGPCGRKALEADPLLLLAPLSAANDPSASAYSSGQDAEDIASIRNAVASVVSVESFRRRIEPPAGHPWMKLAASVMMVAAVGTWFLTRDGKVGVPGGPATSASAGPGTPAAAAPAPAGETLRAGAVETAAPWIENISDPSAQVYQFSPASPGEPVVVFVVNRNVDL